MAKGWTDEEVEFLRKHARTMTFAEIAEKLGKSAKAVNLKASREKINGGKYTQDEIDFIQESAGSASLDHIASKLNRSKKSVWSQMVRLGCSNFHIEAGTYSANALSQLIGVSYQTVYRWIETKGLPAVKKGRQYKVARERMAYHIEVPRFWKWAEKNKDLVEFNKIEKDILPPEPAWVEAERRKQYYNRPKQKFWTTGEDERLLDLYYRQALTQRQVAEKMGRTPSSIEKRLRRLREASQK